MQGRQNISNSERKGPHKSMHCKFCKPPGVVTPEKSTRPQLETKTKLHLAHEAADLKLFQVHDEPGLPAVDSEACICILEGENPCPKCVPDKKKGPIKKKVCRCPKGAKPHPNMLDGTTPKKKKQENQDDEFWWEKYSREHDITAKETWAAYMAQRRKEKKLLKCQNLEQEKTLTKNVKGIPEWYQKLSCQQVIYVEFLSTAIRLDCDENITDRTYFVLAGIGLYPRPKRKIIKKCLRFCHYNAIKFLNQLHLLMQDDDVFNEKYVFEAARSKRASYSWNERLIMSSMCHLEFPALLRDLMDRLPRLRRKKILPQIPYPVFSKIPKLTYENPYEEPLWQDHLNWVEKNKIDRLNRGRTHLDTKRVKIPSLALVKRPSLIDARPPFLNQIEANERASRRIIKEKKKRIPKKYPKPTFNSAIDLTAIASVEASEISITDKIDKEKDEICVFLREPRKDNELIEEEEEENAGEEEEEKEEEDDEMVLSEKEIKFLQEPEIFAAEVSHLEGFSEFGEYSDGQKSDYAATLEESCLVPETLPDSEEDFLEDPKNELNQIDEDLCKFRAFVSSSTQTLNESKEEETIKTVEPERIVEKPGHLVVDDRKEKIKRKKKRKKSQTKKFKKRKKKRMTVRKKSKKNKTKDENVLRKKNQRKKEKKEEKYEDYFEIDYDNQDEGYEENETGQTIIRKDNESSDTESKDFWLTRPPCARDQTAKEEEDVPPKRNAKGESKTSKKRNKRKNFQKKNSRKKTKTLMELREESQEYLKKKGQPAKVDKVTMTECYDGEYDHLYEKPAEPVLQKKENADEESYFDGNAHTLVKGILKDLAEEGYVTASYANIHRHPNIDQLLLYLKGEILDKETKVQLRFLTKYRWSRLDGLPKFSLPELNLSQKKMSAATWNDKNYISRLAKTKKDEFYFKIAKSRADFSRLFYNTLNQNYYDSGRYLKIYCAYMPSKYEDTILRGTLQP